MKTERNYISAYGAVRMTKEESIEMITNWVRYQNFWIHVTVYEEEEEREARSRSWGTCSTGTTATSAMETTSVLQLRGHTTEESSRLQSAMRSPSSTT
eukprot:13167056-Heterocapsa_arctica.AAC.1